MGYSRPAERVGARLARLLNAAGPGGVTRLEPWLIDQALRGILTERYYQLTLVGLREMGLQPPKDRIRNRHNQDQFVDAEVGADAWLRQVLDGPRQMHGSRPLHDGHNTLLLLVSRGVGWPEVELSRAHGAPYPDAPAPAVAVASLAELRRRLEAAGNPEGAGKARRTDGPLWLILDRSAHPVIDQLSLWGAIACAPAACRPLSGEAELAQVHLLADAVNKANRHWDALRRLGLSPPDWMTVAPWEEDTKFDRLSASQALDAIRFVAVAAEIAAEEGREAPVRADYTGAWVIAPISRRLDFDAFASSRAGRAIMDGIGARLSAEDMLDILPPGGTDPATLADESEAGATLDRLEATGTFGTLDMRIVRAVAAGGSLAELHRTDPEVRFRFRKIEALVEHLDTLQLKVAAAVRDLTNEESDDA